MVQDTIKDDIRDYVKKSILKNDSAVIQNDTRLISDRIIDSISTLQLVDFLEKKFKIEFQPHEVDRENLDSIDLITAFVLSKI
jgi:acyl carrier protein